MTEPETIPAQALTRQLLRTYYICIINFKGGIGKTTTAIHIAYYLATKYLLRVLLIDCDLQFNSSRGLTKELSGPTLTQVLKGEVPLHRAIRQVRPNLFLLPSDYDLDTAGKHIISQGMGGYTLLQRSLKALEKGVMLPGFEKRFPEIMSQPPFLSLDQCVFDVVIFDNAGFTPVTESALYTCDSVLSPVELEYFSYEGVFMMMDKLEQSMSQMGRELEILGVVPYNIDERFKMTKTYTVSLKKEYEVEVTDPVRTDGAIKYAQPKAKTVFETEPYCNAAKDFAKLGDQIFLRVKENLEYERQSQRG